MEALVGKELVGKAGPTNLSAIASAEVVCLYLSAHWCGPCREFTPKLAMAYKDAKSNKLPIEIIFVSFDKDQKGFNEYYGSMPWIAIPYGHN